MVYEQRSLQRVLTAKPNAAEMIPSYAFDQHSFILILYREEKAACLFWSYESAYYTFTPSARTRESCYFEEWGIPHLLVERGYGFSSRVQSPEHTAHIYTSFSLSGQ